MHTRRQTWPASRARLMAGIASCCLSLPTASTSTIEAGSSDLPSRDAACAEKRFFKLLPGFSRLNFGWSGGKMNPAALRHSRSQRARKHRGKDEPDRPQRQQRSLTHRQTQRHAALPCLARSHREKLPVRPAPQLDPTRPQRAQRHHAPKRRSGGHAGRGCAAGRPPPSPSGAGGVSPALCVHRPWQLTDAPLPGATGSPPDPAVRQTSLRENAATRPAIPATPGTPAWSWPEP